MDKFFGIKANGSTVRTEIMAGITTFFTMAYIIFVNPDMLATPFIGAPEHGGVFNGVFVATCIAAAIGTLMMALYAKIPFAQAPGMGLNAFFTYTVILGMGYTFGGALAAVFISGLVFIIITVAGLREAVVKAIPHNIKLAITAGIGLFIALIGLKNAGIVQSNEATLVGLVNFADVHSPVTRGAILAVIGLVITVVLYALRIKGSILIGILACTLIAIPFGLTSVGSMGSPVTAPPIGDMINNTFFKMDFNNLLKAGEMGAFGAVMNMILVILSFTMVDMFDTIGTLIGTGRSTGYIKEDGSFPQMKKALMSDAVATSVGACLGTSTVTTYIESGAGISEGGRTGLTSLVTAVLFLLALFFAPLVGIVPSAATAPALIFVGVLMMRAVKDIDFSDITEALPAVLTMFMMPFSYSIATGIAFGLISYAVVKTLTGKWKQVSIITYVLAALFVLRFIFLPT